MSDMRRMEGPIISGPDAVEMSRPVSAVDVPDGLTVPQTEDWVSGDRHRAAAALEVERAKGDGARKSVVETLERLVNGEEGNEQQPGAPVGPAVSPAITPGAEGTV